MKRVSKEGREYPFSKGILASSLDITGLPLGKIYEIVEEVDDELKDAREVPSKKIKKKVREKLLERVDFPTPGPPPIIIRIGFLRYLNCLVIL